MFIITVITIAIVISFIIDTYNNRSLYCLDRIFSSMPKVDECYKYNSLVDAIQLKGSTLDGLFFEKFY